MLIITIIFFFASIPYFQNFLHTDIDLVKKNVIPTHMSRENYHFNKMEYFRHDPDCSPQLYFVCIRAENQYFRALPRHALDLIDSLLAPQLNPKITFKSIKIDLIILHIDEVSLVERDFLGPSSIILHDFILVLANLVQVAEAALLLEHSFLFNKKDGILENI
ncbi:hypothetical protein BpHYR1_021781 [Brachionus plicatilis]|uniref:Uncharacterized protein n=1 Tax=Brachionus plicatilis TaxID=10195 RepID=A0A3M7P880_BRAPC|nr:hypothetical protein BpHYR1_021781 [Brachionus plicatilis]